MASGSNGNSKGGGKAGKGKATSAKKRINERKQAAKSFDSHYGKGGGDAGF
jgi:hypothetical protein